MRRVPAAIARHWVLPAKIPHDKISARPPAFDRATAQNIWIPLQDTNIFHSTFIKSENQAVTMNTTAPN